MWKNVQIADEDYFLMCSISADDEIKCVLYNLKGSWCERQNFQTALQITKKLNKRIQYNLETVRATLQQGTPEEVDWEQQDNTTERILKLKYRVNKRPFNFEWRLRMQKEEEHNETMLLPLLKTVQGMAQQMAELREIVRKKDVEIGQYKTEGAILRRTTVATHPFDISTFQAKFADTNTLSESLLPVAQHLEKHFEHVPQSKAVEPKAEASASIKSEVKTKSESPQAIKAKQKNKKRQALEMQQRHLARKLQAQKQKLEYENSQSQSLSQSSTEAAVSTDPVGTSSTAFDAERLVEDILEFSTGIDVEPLDRKSQDLLAIQKALLDLEEQRIADMKRRSQEAGVSESNKRVKMSRN